jgi:putative tryptophan/tyrosine transport system substrate-binding protein
MRRREFLKFLGTAASLAPLRAAAQEKQFRIELISAAPPTPEMLGAFRDAMRERGYIEGQNVAFDVRWPRRTFNDDPAVVTDLVNGKFDVIVAWATPTVAAVRRLTSSIPIVMVSVGDPVGAGFVASLARPGGNITGVSNVTNDLSAKLVELFFEFVPAKKRVGVVSNSYNSNVAVQLRETMSALEKFNVQTKVVEARTAEEYDQAFAALAAARVEGVILLSDPSVVEHAQRIAELARTAMLPTAFRRRESVMAGGLFSYGGSIPNQYRFAAVYVDRILKGARPAELPVEQPTKFELVINLKTAKALDLPIPPTLLARADEVIE